MSPNEELSTIDEDEGVREEGGVVSIGPAVMACGPLGVGADGQGLGPNAFGSFTTKLGTAANLLALPPYLTIAKLNWWALACSRNVLELRPWWRDARLPNKTKGV